MTSITRLSPAPGVRLGPYLIARRLAVGGMAEIFEAVRDGTRKRVVLKVLLPQYAADPEFVAMLADEARLTAGLSHPSLVRVLEAGDGYLAMEHVDGPPLSQILRQSRREQQGLPVGLALLVAERLLEALAYVHSRTDESGRSLEIVHRDISPGNVLVNLRGEVKLGDFGIARHRLRSSRTRTGVIKGTLQYMAPEQVLGGTETDRRTDLYGVGLLLFEMLTGRPFVEADREVDLIRLVQDPPWTPPSSVRPGLDPRLDRALRPALCRFPEERYPDAGVFLAALQRLHQELAPTDPSTLQAGLAALAARALESARAGALTMDARATSTPSPTAPTRRATPPRRVDRRLPVLLLVGAGLVAGAGWAAWRLGSRHAGQMRASDGRHQTIWQDGRIRPDLRAAVKASQPPRLDGGRPTPRHDLRHRPAQVRRAPPQAKPMPADARAPLDPQPLRRRLETALAGLRARGVLEEDLPSDLGRRLQQVRAQLSRGDVSNLSPSLQELERLLPSVLVDRGLVEAKLKRVHALLRHRPEAAALRERASTALQEFMDGRHAVANHHLNEILRVQTRH